jgi:Calpain family cysteine protease
MTGAERSARSAARSRLLRVLAPAYDGRVPGREHAEAPALETARAARTPPSAAPASFAALALQLQRTAGNAAATRVLQRLVNPRARTTASGQDDTGLATQRFAGDVFVYAPGEDTSGVRPEDVVQGQLGDCYFLSPLMAAARINPRRIQRLIRGPVETRPDGTRIFEVDLYEGHWIGSPSRRTFRVDDRFVTASGGGARYAQPGQVGAHGAEIWVMLLEKAWAAMRGGYDQAHFGLMKDGLTAVTGYDTDDTSIDGTSDAKIFREISRCVADGKPVTIQTKQSFSSAEMDEMQDIEYTIFAKHAYNVASVDPTWQTIDIMNPHGSNHLRGFPLVRLRRFFDYYVMSEHSVR